MRTSGIYMCFDEYRSEDEIKRSHQEIEQAIDEVTGRDVDIKIQKIWERVLK